LFTFYLTLGLYFNIVLPYIKSKTLQTAR